MPERRPDAPIIADIRRMLADPDQRMTTFTTRGPFPSGLGIRPRLLDDSGIHKVWEINRDQARKLLDEWDRRVEDEQAARYD